MTIKIIILVVDPNKQIGNNWPLRFCYKIIVKIYANSTTRRIL